jgi:hypothetical protein
MTILLIFSALTALCIVVAVLVPYHSDIDIPFTIAAVVFGLITGTMLITIPIERESIRANIQAMEATRQTFETARAKTDNIERFSRLDEVISWNKWLAREKYNNDHMWDVWVPDEIANVKPIE